MNRRQRVLHHLRPSEGRGVEIGPLTCPIILRGDGDVLYADHLARDGLREKYAGHDLVGGTDAIVDVDVILGGTSFREALGPRGPVDYILAAHVFEHILDPIGWLGVCAEALHEGGKICLIVPDKRFTFDHHRATTSVGELIAAHLTGLPLAAIYEYHARAQLVDGFAVWRGESAEPIPDAPNRAGTALQVARDVAATGRYVDAHCTVFTPWSFVATLTEVIALGLVPLAFDAVEPTERPYAEFLVSLVKRSDLSPAERAATAPPLDPRRHHDLPKPRWTARLRSFLRPFS